MATRKQDVLTDPRVPGVTVGFEEVTPELAEKWLTMVPVRQRLRSDDSVDQYAGDQAGGVWYFDGNTYVFNDRNELVNGQHRAESVVRSRVPVMALVVRGVTPEAIQVMDTNRPRSFADTLRMNGVPNHAGASSLTKRVLHWQRGNYGTRGVPRIKDPAYLYTKQSIPALWNTYRQYADDIQSATLKGASMARHFRNEAGAPASILGFAWLLLRRYGLDTAEQFFHELLVEPALTGPEYPIRVLEQRLSRSNDDGVPDWAWLHYTIRTYNAWLNSESLSNSRLRRPAPVSERTVALPLDVLADERPAGWEPL